jgi:hypothetical protein
LDSFTVRQNLGSVEEDASPWALCDVATQFDTLGKLDFKFTADNSDLQWQYSYVYFHCSLALGLTIFAADETDLDPIPRPR